MRISRHNFLSVEWDAEDKEDAANAAGKEAKLKKAGYTRVGPPRQKIPKSSYMIADWSRPIYSFTGVGCEKIDQIVV